MDMLVVNENEHPMSLQLFGHDIETMVYAAKVLDKQTNCDIIDINMGCPVTKVIKAQAGSSLMREVDHAAAIVKAVTNFTDAKLLAELSEDLGEAMVGINEQEIELLMAERGK